MNLIIQNITENPIVVLCAAIIFVAVIIILQKTWLKRYAHKAGVELPQDFDRTIEKFVEKYTPQNISIKFQYRVGGDTLGGCLERNNEISLTQGWKLRILLDTNNRNHDKLVNAYVETIGHEMAHKRKKKLKKFTIGKGYKYICWVDEIYADFGSCDQNLGKSRLALVEALKYKKMVQEEMKKQSKLPYSNLDPQHCSHPCWADRIRYAEQYDFGEDLLKTIAKDVKLKNQTLIKELLDYYLGVEGERKTIITLIGEKRLVS